MIFRSLLLLLVLAGCGSTPTQVFTLAASSDRTANPAPAGRAPLIHVDRASVAEYFDRTQMVTRIGDFRLSLQEFSVWSEPIGDLITRAVVDDLARRFGDDRVLRTPRSRGPAPDARIELDVLRFDIDEAGIATLDARWTILAADAAETQRRERITEPGADAKDATSRVVALRRALTVLAGRIGDAVPAPRRR
jgi:uncharacterized protein